MYHYILIYRAILEPGLERLLQVSESTLKTASDILYMYHYIFIYRAILEPGLERLLQVSESTLKTASIIHCENIITDK